MNLAIYTDGSCLGNPGPGGWAYLIEFEGKKIRGQGGESPTTNNRMELKALIEGLKDAGELFPEEKTIDVWAELEPHLKGKKISWNWVKGHNGHPQNEDCDVRAQKEAGKQPRRALEGLPPPPRYTSLF